MHFPWRGNTIRKKEGEVVPMFKHEKQLFHPVNVERPNPQYAALLQEQLGGANGELKATKMYFSMSEPLESPFCKCCFCINTLLQGLF